MQSNLHRLRAEDIDILGAFIKPTMLIKLCTPVGATSAQKERRLFLICTEVLCELVVGFKVLSK